MLITELIAERAGTRATHPFLFHDGRRITYGDFDRLTNRTAHALLELGVQRGDRVTVAMGNSIEYLLAAFGALKAGAIYHPINATLGAAEISYILGHAEPRLIITDRDNVAHLRNDAVRLPSSATLAAFAAAGDVTDLDPLLARSADTAPAIDLTASDASTLLYTSGTTGNPKGVLFRHGSTGAAGHHFLEALGIDENDTILAVTPLFHGNAWGAVGTALQAGGTVAFPKGFKASEFWPLVHESGATVLYTLGTILAILLTREQSELERTSHLRVILGLGSAPIRDQIIRRFGVKEVAECFGSTDAGVVTITPLGAAPRAGSCGPAVSGITLRVIDDNGNTLPVRQPGEILVQSPHCMSEYFRDPEQTAQTVRDGWFHTGDLGYLDEDGWLYFVDRKKDVIRRGGENMSSAFIEKVLREHPRVVEAAVIGIPDPVLGQEVKAFIVANGPVTTDELREFASARLAKFQVPRLWEFRDSLPKTPTQRIEKYKLRQESGGSDKPLLG
jgi:acyl-CoA synthetase (AMP-forming)/AMP-acid ligase II